MTNVLFAIICNPAIILQVLEIPAAVALAVAAVVINRKAA